MRTPTFRPFVPAAVSVSVVALALALALAGCAAEKAQPTFTAAQASAVLFSAGGGELPEGITLQRGENATLNLDSFATTQTSSVSTDPADCKPSLVPLATVTDAASAENDQVTTGAQILVDGSAGVPVALTQAARHTADPALGAAVFEASRKAVEQCGDLALATPNGDMQVQRTVETADLAVDGYRVSVLVDDSVVATEWVLRSGNVIAALSTSGNETKVADAEKAVTAFADRMAEGPVEPTEG